MCERLDEGVEFLRKAEEGYESVGVGIFRPVALAQLGLAYMRAGGLSGALALGQRIVSLSRERHERGFEARGVHLLAEVASWPDPPDVDRASQHYQQAIALASELAMRPLVAHCHLGLGKLYGRTGQRESAQEHLRTATTMYREMDMRFWLEQAEASLHELT
jgi:tetratricopeptide (TPR) repeat protein